MPGTIGVTGLTRAGSQSFAYTPPLTPLGFIASNGVIMVLGPQ